jgi:hypothetical protein
MKDDDDDIQDYVRPWVGLTEEEIDRIWVPHTFIQATDRRQQAFARAIEAKLKEKNT